MAECFWISLYRLPIFAAGHSQAVDIPANILNKNTGTFIQYVNQTAKLILIKSKRLNKILLHKTRMF